MQILWKGQTCISLSLSRGKQEQVKILIDPFGESTGIKLSPQEADILLVTHGKPETKGVKGTPILFSTPGEYEVKDIFIQGIGETNGNVIYTMEAEGMKVCHLGAIQQQELTSGQIEKIGTVHVLFIPVGGGDTIDAQEAARMVSQLEPAVVIPMRYAIPGLKEKLGTVEQFLKTMGVKEGEPQQKVILKQKDVEGEEEMKLIVLKPS
ncbi:MAG: MBL fold metallo-hydrolase [Candidatus Yanofskybacteria bacterium]|nr:MBL fold metallo-hydrolase [Candidatus Yanofskybacteria bacterium]